MSKYCDAFQKICKHSEDGFKCAAADGINIKIAIKCNGFKCPLGENKAGSYYPPLKSHCGIGIVKDINRIKEYY